MDADKTVTASFNAETEPIIDVWYGSIQSFGDIGNPQPWFNILGNVSDGDGVASLMYSLNGAAAVTLTIGPDNRRLERAGDFNVDLATADLQDGANTVAITATDGVGNTRTRTVIVNYQSGTTWPLPYSVNWGSLPSDGDSQTPDGAIQSVAQVVDGKWTLEGERVRTVEPGYDRSIAIGDELWTDYEATVPIIVHSGAGNWGVGLIFHWNGNTDDPVVCPQPKCGWEPLGALGWIAPDRIEFWIAEGNTVPKSFPVTLGTTYWLKMRVETDEVSGALYSLKVWEDGQDEPSAWDLSHQGEPSDPQHVSVLLLAYLAEASFGDVTIVPWAE
jgi:hypothetical protein